MFRPLCTGGPTHTLISFEGGEFIVPACMKVFKMDFTII